MATNGAGNNSLSVFSLLDALRRRKLFVIIPTLLLGAGFTYYAHKQPNRYRAQALISAEHVAAPEYLHDVAPQSINIQDHLWTVRQVLYSPEVLTEAAREIKQYRDLPNPLPEDVLDAVKSGIDVKVANDQTFNVIFDGADPVEVANVANRLAKSFVARASQQHEEKADDAAKVINDQITALNQRLQAQDLQIKDYKEHAIEALPEQMDSNSKAVDSLQQQYDALTAKIAEEEAHRSTITREMSELEQQGVLTEPQPVDDKSPEEAKLEELKIKEKELATQYTPKWPAVVEIKGEIADLEKTIAAHPKAAHKDPSPTYMQYVEMKAELPAINTRIDAYEKNQKQISAQMVDYHQRIAATPANERALAAMNREYTVGESEFHDLLDKQLDAKLSKGFVQSETGIAFVIADPATVPGTPYSPQRTRLALMGLVAGLGMGLVAAFLMEQNDTTFASVDDFQSFTNVPVIGIVPNVATKKGADSKDLMVTTSAPDSVAAEQYRILAMKVQQQCVASNAKVIMLTSAAGGEGKSMTAVNLAFAMAAAADGPVLLVDGDMRKPRIQEYLNIHTVATKTFPALLTAGDVDPAGYVVKTRNLHVIPGAVSQGNPVAAISSPRARILFDQLKKDYRYVIVDAPPTLPIADAHILAALSDKVLFVVRARKTPRELFQHAVESFDMANVLGTVLNDVDYQRSRYAYAYEYYKKSA